MQASENKVLCYQLLKPLLEAKPLSTRAPSPAGLVRCEGKNPAEIATMGTSACSCQTSTHLLSMTSRFFSMPLGRNNHTIPFPGLWDRQCHFFPQVTEIKQTQVWLLTPLLQEWEESCLSRASWRLILVYLYQEPIAGNPSCWVIINLSKLQPPFLKGQVEGVVPGTDSGGPGTMQWSQVF